MKHVLQSLHIGISSGFGCLLQDGRELPCLLARAVSFNFPPTNDRSCAADLSEEP